MEHWEKEKNVSTSIASVEKKYLSAYRVNMMVATLKPKNSYRLQWLSNTCPNFFLASQLTCCEKRKFVPKGGKQGICFIYT